MNFLSQNLEIYEAYSSLHGINTRHALKINKPSTKFSMYQKGFQYGYIIKRNKFPVVIAELWSNKKYFNTTKKYLIGTGFCSLEEYLNT